MDGMVDNMHKAARITVTRSDVLWNYIGTAVSMLSNFMLIPLLLIFLTSEQIGLWYVFTAISGFAQLLEFGFTPTLARNIRYCLSGATKLTRKGVDSSRVSEVIDWHLLKSVLSTSRVLYGIIGLIAFILVLTVGSAYIWMVTGGFAIEGSLPAWLVFAVSIFTNLYFLYRLTFLQGLGDIASENKAKTFARIGQISFSAILLFMGFGLLSASAGYLFYSIAMQGLAGYYFKSHSDVQDGIHSDCSEVTRRQIKETFATISFIAWRDGVVSIALYGATQAMSLVCSAFLGLSQTATYSVMLQFAGAVHNISSTYFRSCFPMFQSAYLRGEIHVQRSVIERGVTCYVIMFLVSTVAVDTIVLPLLTLFRDDFICDQTLYFGLSIYYFLLSHHSLFCNIIVSMNEIPYYKSYILSSLAGICLSSVLCGVFKMGAWGLVLGQALPQLLYNNWRWPKYVLDRIGSSYPRILANGSRWWLHKIANVFGEQTHE